MKSTLVNYKKIFPTYYHKVSVACREDLNQIRIGWVNKTVQVFMCLPVQITF